MLRRRGFVLVIVLALLGVMAFLAVDFAQKSQVSRTLSLRQVSKTLATLAARSGIEKTLSASCTGSLQNNNLPFGRQLAHAGEDINRNGSLDSGEDLNRNARIDAMAGSETSPCPSLAVPDSSMPPSARQILLDGTPRGFSWSDNPVSPSVACALSVWADGLDINAGISSGRGPAGAQYQSDTGLPYSASDPLHPFNQPLRYLLNAWGNVWKYRAMVRPDKTYDWSQSIDTDRNSPEEGDTTLPYTSERFDMYHPSELCAAFGDVPLGDRLISARPPQGYQDLSTPLSIVEDYVKGWTDTSGLKGYPDGDWRRQQLFASPIPIDAVTPTHILEVRQAFEAVAATSPTRSLRQLFRRQTPDDDQISGILTTAFDSNTDRGRRWVKIYPLSELPADVNSAPVDVLAALIHSIGDIHVRAYAPHAAFPEQGKSLQTYSPLDIGPALGLAAALQENAFVRLGHSVGEPTARLLSMTESLRLAHDLAIQRASRRFGSHADVHAFIMAWKKGYDGRSSTSPIRVKVDATCNQFNDIHFGWERNRLLSLLLNPHLNSQDLILDEALPRGLENRANGIGVNGPAGQYAMGNRPYHIRFLFDKFDRHHVGGHLDVHSSGISIQSRGWAVDPAGRFLASTRLRIHAEPLSVLRIRNQVDWERACTHPTALTSTLGGKWISYPESDGVQAPWDGHLALKPLNDADNPMMEYGDALNINMPLHAFNSSHHPTVNHNGREVWPLGPRVIPESESGIITNKLRNSLVPAPGMGLSSLIPQAWNDLDKASDLAPGGGLMVTPWNNSGLSPKPDPANTNNDRLRKEALLILRNTYVDQSVDDNAPDGNLSGVSDRVLPDLISGAVSFYFKPSMTPPNPDDSFSVQGRTLFFTPFMVEDEETVDRCNALGSPLKNERDTRKWHAGHIRLVWGTLQNSVKPTTGGYDHLLLGFNRAVQLGTSIPIWPYLQASPSATWPNFQQGPKVFFFKDSDGLHINGTRGHIPAVLTQVNGLGSASPAQLIFNREDMPLGSNSASRMAWGDATKGIVFGNNPYPNETLFLEIFVSRFSKVPVSHNPGLNPLLSPLGNPKWYDVSYLPTNLAMTSSYLQPKNQPLNLFDTSDAVMPDHHAEDHAVRKLFTISHPVDVGDGITSGGTGAAFKDPMGFHQPLLVPGRWNHIFIAWKNMWNLLDNTDPDHGGGALALWLNGTFRKTVDGKSMAGMFLMTDTSLAYMTLPGDALIGTAFWEPGKFHRTYQPTDASDPYYPTGHLLKTWHIPFSASELKPGVNHMHFPSIVPLPYPGEVGYESGPPGHPLRAHSICHAFGHYNFMATEVWLNLPPRLYFGCQPHSLFNPDTNEPFYFPTGIAWGAFMDIQVFKSPSDNLKSSNDGGFNSDMPNYDSRTPFASSSQIETYPLRLMNPEGARLVGLSWSAYLPEFNHFWDDQNTPGNGPDANDAQRLEAHVKILGTDMGTLVVSQIPSSSSPSLFWQPTTPITLTQASDLEVIFRHRGPPVVLSTPVIESLDVAYIPSHIKLSGMTVE